MSGGRDRERDRRAAAAARTNEYFVPKDGIDREVITADICRYLGNDALVRPGNYEDPLTRQIRPGYFINAYRNLTTEMIADLKADSERWETERRAASTRGQPSNVGYRDSTTHQARQYYGPTEAQPGGTPGHTPNTAGSQVGYNDGQQYQQQASYSQAPGPSYSQPTYSVAPDNYYVAGANFGVDQPSRARVPAGQTGINDPRTIVSNVQYSGASSYQQPDSRSNYYAGQAGAPASSNQAYPPPQPQDPYYARAPLPTDNMYSPQDTYDNRPNYQANGSYSQSQPPMTQSTPAVVPNTSSRREREREPEPRDRHSHRSNRR